MKLDIYEGKKIVKTYETDTYSLMFGTVEDVADAIKLDDMKTGTDAEIMRMALSLVMTSKDTVKHLMLDIFDGLTAEELRNTRVADQAAVLVEVALFTIRQIEISGRKKG